MSNERVYPTVKPPPATANGGAATNPTFPPNKSQLYNANRPAYRPQPPPKRRRHRRTCFCTCCLWSTLFIILILFLAAIAGAVFYVLYRPHRPSFSVTNLRLSTFNLTDTSITTNFNLTVTARNPNKKITFFYDEIGVKFVSNGVNIGDGSFPSFTHGRKNVTDLKSVVKSDARKFGDGEDVTKLRSGYKSKSLVVKVELETKVKMRVGKIVTKKLRVRVICDGFKISVPSGNTTTVASNTGKKVKCKVDPRFKIFKWTV